MKIEGKGLLAHHFHGTYWASMILELRSRDDAAALLASGLLGQGWTLSRRQSPGVLRWEGNGTELDGAIDCLVALGADRAAIDSIAHSIDYGDPWSISAELPDPRQLALAS